MRMLALRIGLLSMGWKDRDHAGGNITFRHRTDTRQTDENVLKDVLCVAF
jgi:hypothetical protein